MERIELSTPALRKLCSTVELHRQPIHSLQKNRPIINYHLSREPVKIAFITRPSDTKRSGEPGTEIFAGKADGQNSHRRSQSYVEDRFWPDNAASRNCSRL